MRREWDVSGGGRDDRVMAAAEGIGEAGGCRRREAA